MPNRVSRKKLDAAEARRRDDHEYQRLLENDARTWREEGSERWDADSSDAEDYSYDPYDGHVDNESYYDHEIQVGFQNNRDRFGGYDCYAKNYYNAGEEYFRSIDPEDWNYGGYRDVPFADEDGDVDDLLDANDYGDSDGLGAAYDWYDAYHAYFDRKREMAHAYRDWLKTNPVRAEGHPAVTVENAA